MILTHIFALVLINAPQAAPGLPAPALIKSVPAIRASGNVTTSLTLTRIAFTPAVTESAPLLSGFRLRPVEVSGRTPLSEIGANVGSVIQVAAGASAVQLPGSAAIRVFHYEKPQPKLFGFFALRGQGEFQLLVERPGLGSNGVIDPFDPVIGVSRDGKTISISASDPKQGVQGIGDIWLVRCDGQALANGTFIRELTGPGVQESSGVSQTFFGEKLYAVVDSGLAVAAADGSTGFSSVPLPPSAGVVPVEVTSEMVNSADGNKLAILAGADEDHLDVYMMEVGGSVSNLTQNPQPLVTPGFLPETAEGPLFALAPDGSAITYQIDQVNGNELFTRSSTPGSTPFHLTPDPVFDTSIDQMSGILTGGSFTRFLAASGQLNADLYRSTLPGTGAPTLSNLTKTSGAATPFFPNTATLQVNAQANLRGGRLLVDDRTTVAAGFDLWFSTSGDLTGISLAALDQPPTLVAPSLDAKSIALIAARGPQSFLLSYDGLNPPRNLLKLPPGVAIDSLAARDGGSVFAIAAKLAGLSFVVQLAASGGALNIVQGAPFSNARDLLYGRDQRLLFAASQGAGTQTFFVNSTQQAIPAGALAPIAFWLR